MVNYTELKGLIPFTKRPTEYLLTIPASNISAKNIVTSELEVSGSIEIGGHKIKASKDSVIINTALFRLANMTTVERDAIIATNGDMIYNTDTNKFQGYANGAWVDLNV